MTLRRLGIAICAIGAFFTPVTACSEAERDAERADPAWQREDSRRQSSPGSRSGHLGKEDLPAPIELGDGWSYRVDPGDPEAGYVGSGRPAIARDPSSVIAAVTPLGCRPQPLPAPTRALEVTYQKERVPGVALILQFDSTGAAREFFEVHSSVISECAEARRIDVEVIQASSDTYVSTRTEDLGDTRSWAEGMAVTGERVMLVAVADPTDRGVRAVVSAVR